MMVFFRHRIITTFRPGMTTQQPQNAHPQASERAPLLNGIDHVLRTGGTVPATGRRKRGDAFLITANGQYQQELKEFNYAGHVGPGMRLDDFPFNVVWCSPVKGFV